MQPHDTTVPAGSKPPLRSSTMRYVITVALLVLMVGGLAWIAQYLPSWRKQIKVAPPPDEKQKLLSFPRAFADWRTTEARKEDKEKPPDPVFVEPATKGFYDFLFKNEGEVDVDLDFCRTGCDCASVKVCLLPAGEWTTLNEQQKARPGLPLSYAPEPTWHTMPREPASGRAPALRVKAGEQGALRVEWTAGAAGSDLNLGPVLWFHPAGDSNRPVGHPLFVPGKVAGPVQLDRQRLIVGPLTAGKSDTKIFFVWSSTRESLDLSVVQDPPDPLFVFAKPRLLSKEEAVQLQASLNITQFTTRVTCAYEVKVTVHESHGGRYLDQGFFYRRFPFALDGRPDPNAPIWGPEIVGRIEGDFVIGGEEDKGRIQFKSFSAKEGTSKELTVITDVTVELQTIERHADQPAYLQVKLTRGDKQPGSDRAKWHLEVTVPPKAARAGRFDEPSAVVLRIAGTGRLLRIPLEGRITE